MDDPIDSTTTEEEKTGDMTLREYAETYNISLEPEAYRREFPEDAPFTYPPTKGK